MDIIAKWITLQNEGLLGLNLITNNFWLIRLRRMRLVRHVARMGRTEMHTVLVRKTEGEENA
jgi:hypothetical protein